MNVLIISSPDPFRNAGRVALDLFRGLKENQDFSVEMLVKYAREKEPGIISYYNTFGFYFNKAKNLAFSFLKGKKIVSDPNYYFQEYDQTKNIYSSKKLLKRTRKPDVILLLFMQKFISFRNVREFQEMSGAHIIMYPLDMALMTGGCHYSWECMNFTVGCGNCPAIYSSNSSDQSNCNLNFKREQIADIEMTLLAANKQTHRQIKTSAIFRNKRIVDGMYFEIDNKIYYNRNVLDCRKEFVIAEHRLVFFFGSVGLQEKRKGIRVLDESLVELKKKLIDMRYDLSRVLLLVAGGDYEEKDSPFEVKYLGQIKDVSQLAKAYSAADYFVCPSLEDTGPTMVLQAIFSNTPVIGFNIGYIEEFIIDGANGFVAGKKDKLSLCDALFRAVNTGQNEHQKMKQELALLTESITGNPLKEKVTKLIREL